MHSHTYYNFNFWVPAKFHKQLKSGFLPPSLFFKSPNPFYFLVILKGFLNEQKKVPGLTCFFLELWTSEAYFILNLLWEVLACLMQDSLERQWRERQALLKRTKSIKSAYGIAFQVVWGYRGSGEKKILTKRYDTCRFWLPKNTVTIGLKFQGIFQVTCSVALLLNEYIKKYLNHS